MMKLDWKCASVRILIVAGGTAAALPEIGARASAQAQTQQENIVSKRFIMLTVFTAVFAVLVLGLVLLAQNMTPPGRFIPSAQWQKELDANQPTLGLVAGQTATIVPNLVVRRRLAVPNNASVHTAAGDGQDVTEIYQILDGSGTYVTGGSIPDPKNRTAGIKGGESHDVKPGDFVVIPPGTAHWFSKINDHITYVEVRLPGNVLAAK